MRRVGVALAGVFLAALCFGLPAPAKKSARAARPPLDFSGVWELDSAASINVPHQMENAVLSVTQKGNRIWISPVTEDKQPSLVMAEEIVADGKAYEKAIGPAGKGLVTAAWGKDRKSLWIEVKAGDEADPKKNAIQRSVWTLSADRNVWTRQSVTVSRGTPKTARVVFRRRTSKTTPTRTPAAAGSKRKS